MKRLVPFLAALSLLAVPSVASAHTAAADLSCAVPHPVLTVDLVDYQGAHVTIAVDHVVVVDQDFASQFHTTRNVGGPSEGHTATVTVTASDSAEYDRTFDLSSPPCVTLRPAPRARIVICGDPLARFTLDNSRSDVAVRFRMVWHSYPLGTLRVYSQVVAARSVDIAPLRHVLGGTRLFVTALHRVLASRISPPAGDYGSCQDRTVRE